MKKLIVLMLAVAICSIAYNQPAGNKKMAVTTNSEAAKKLYDQATTAMEDVELGKFVKLSNEALREDPDFFMANKNLATYHMYFGNDQKFREYAGKAVNCKSELSEGEMLLKDALKRLLDDREADVTDIGKKLVEKYPQDINAYYSLNMFQSVIKDYEGAVKTLKSGLKIAERPGPIYNMLGYTYLSLNETENAAAAFDKYIEMEPDNPNTYDSKGDYYMAVKDYTRAYESFMKANEIDSSWGMGKALKAKALSDSLLKK